MRILITGDSLGLPRPHKINSYSPDEKDLAVAYEHTYGSLINKALLKEYNINPYIEIINRSRRFSTIKNIYEEFSDHLFFYEPDVIVMQVGIVDCWYRDHLNGAQLVKKADYEKYFNEILRLLKYRPNCRLIVIGICPTSLKMEKKYKGINKEIILYNEILQKYIDYKNIFYINMANYVNKTTYKQYLLPDGSHLSKEGNKLLAHLLLNIIKSFIFSDKGVQCYQNEEHEVAWSFFEQSYQHNPYYIDNLYNFLILSYQLKKYSYYNQISNFIEANILDQELKEVSIALNSELK